MYTQFVRTKPLQVITLSEAKQHLNLVDDDGSDDDLLRTLIGTVSELVESHTNRLLSQCTVTAEFDLCQMPMSIFLPYAPATMTSVQVDGVDINYTHSPIRNQITVPVQSLTLPSVVTLTFEAGDDVPDSLKAAAKIWLSDLYEYRESKIEGQFTSAPVSVKTLIDRFKLPASIQNG